MKSQVDIMLLLVSPSPGVIGIMSFQFDKMEARYHELRQAPSSSSVNAIEKPEKSDPNITHAMIE